LTYHEGPAIIKVIESITRKLYEKCTSENDLALKLNPSKAGVLVTSTGRSHELHEMWS
jgi:hypothetical protein